MLINGSRVPQCMIDRLMCLTAGSSKIRNMLVVDTVVGDGLRFKARYDCSLPSKFHGWFFWLVVGINNPRDVTAITHTRDRRIVF